MGKDVGALEGLGGEAEDVVDDEDGVFGAGGAGGVLGGFLVGVGVIGLGLGEGRTAFHFIELDVFALFFVAVGDDRGDAAAGLGSISRIIPFSVNSVDMVCPPRYVRVVPL